MAPLSLPAFIARWQRSTLSERSAAQSHFIDLCRLLGEPAPAEADPTGEFYSFEKGLRKSTGGDGFADVWKRGFFAWEYKGKHKSLVEAYRQLQMYQADLDYPPLLVTCDFDQFEIHTAFNNSGRQSYRFRLADLADPAHRKLDAAVLDGYGWPHALADEQILERLLELNRRRETTEGDSR